MFTYIFKPEIPTCDSESTAAGNVGWSLQQSENVQQCQNLLKLSWESFDTKGISDMIMTIAKQYESFPSGPYVYCYENIQQGQENSLGLVRFVHPYLNLNETIETTVKGLDAQNAAKYESSYQTASIKAVEDCCGNIFNFTLNFSQSKSEDSGGQVVSGPLRDYLGFSGTYEDGYFICGCPTTDIPPGDRNNDNAAILLSAAC